MARLAILTSSRWCYVFTLIIVLFPNLVPSQVYKPYPRTGELLGQIETNLFLCQLSEQAAQMSFELYAITQSDEKKKKSEEAQASAQKCVNEARKKMQPLFKNAQAELQKNSEAVKKLKELIGTWIGIISSMPRATLSRSALAIRQQEDKKNYNAKDGALQAELL